MFSKENFIFNKENVYYKFHFPGKKNFSGCRNIQNLVFKNVYIESANKLVTKVLSPIVTWYFLRK